MYTSEIVSNDIVYNNTVFSINIQICTYFYQNRLNVYNLKC